MLCTQQQKEDMKGGERGRRFSAVPKEAAGGEHSDRRKWKR